MASATARSPTTSTLVRHADCLDCRWGTIICGSVEVPSLERFLRDLQTRTFKHTSRYQLLGWDLESHTHHKLLPIASSPHNPHLHSCLIETSTGT